MKNNKIKKLCGYIFLFALLISHSLGISAQNTESISLDSCLKLAAKNYPLAKQNAYLQDINKNTLKGINGSWLPQINMVSTATYQSEVTDFDFPDFPAINFPKDQYSFGLQINQNIYDGGLTEVQRDAATAATAMEIQKNEVELYKLNERVTQIYGNILLAKENINVLQSYMNDISGHRASVLSAVTNGTMLQTNLDILDVEVLNTKQKIFEANANLQALYQTLALYTGRQVNDSTVFEDIPVSLPLPQEIKRPELLLFDLQKDLFSEKSKLTDRAIYPKLSVFADGAYGRPGYNFLNQDFRFYGIAGISLKWNISSFYNISYDRENLAINTQMLDVQKNVFLLNLQANTIQENAEIQNLTQMIETDRSIVEKRKAISRSASEQLNSGLITSSDYLTELTAEKQAVLNQRMHEIKLGIAEMNYTITTGK